MLYEFKDTHGFISYATFGSVLQLNKEIVELLEAKQFEIELDGNYVDRIRIAGQDKWDKVHEVLGEHHGEGCAWFTATEVEKFLSPVDEVIKEEDPMDAPFAHPVPEVPEQKYAVLTTEATGQYLMRRKDASLDEAEAFAKEWVNDTGRQAIVVIGVSRFEEKKMVVVDKKEF